MGYEKRQEARQEKISANQERIDAITQTIDELGNANGFTFSKEVIALLEERAKLKEKNQRLQEKNNKLDAKYDAVNKSLQKLFGEHISLPDKDSKRFEIEANIMVRNIKNALSARAKEDPEWAKDFINNMQYGTIYQGATHIIAGAVSFGIHSSEARQFREAYPDLSNLLDAGFRIKGNWIQRYHDDHTPYVDVENVQIIFDPTGKVEKNINHHQAEDFGSIDSGAIDRQAMRNSTREGRKEEREANQYYREQRREARRAKREERRNRGEPEEVSTEGSDD